jgi:hypothetical protein
MRDRRADAEYTATEREAMRDRRATAEYATTEREANEARRADAQYATTEREANNLAKRDRRTEKGGNEVHERSHRFFLHIWPPRMALTMQVFAGPTLEKALMLSKDYLGAAWKYWQLVLLKRYAAVHGHQR